MQYAMFPAALAALTLSSPAFADDSVEPESPFVGCGDHCGKKQPQPAPPVPVAEPVPAPAPEPAPEPPVAPPAPEAPVVPPPAPPVAPPVAPAPPELIRFTKNPKRFRMGGSVAVAPSVWSLPAMPGYEGLEQPHPNAGIIGLEGGVGAYIGLWGYEAGAPYFDLHGHFVAGTIRSSAWSGGATLGAAVQDQLILGLIGEGLTRDYGVRLNTATSRLIGGRVGATVIVDLQPKTSAPGARVGQDAVDFSFVLAAMIGGGTTLNAATDEAISGPDGTIRVELRVGGKQ